VREAANGLETVFGPDIREHPHFREVLIDSSVAINAAQTAYNLHVEVERAGKWEIDVLYGVFNLFNHRVVSPARINKSAGDNAAGLAFAPTNPRDFKTLAIELAKTYEDRFFKREGGSNGQLRTAAPSLVQVVEDNGDH
jgi:hypothetical protein